jgi:hypothetical protein
MRYPLRGCVGWLPSRRCCMAITIVFERLNKEVISCCLVEEDIASRPTTGVVYICIVSDLVIYVFASIVPECILK